MSMMLALLLAADQDVVIEMSDGTREVQVGKTGVRIEVHNRGDDEGHLLPSAVSAKFITKEMADSGGKAKAWT